MADYYSLLESKIKETLDDPAKVRQVVYEAARLALKRQVLLQQPPITIREGKRLLDDLEDAITRCEADLEESSAAKSTKLKAHETAKIASTPKRAHDSDDGEDGDAFARTSRAAPDDSKAGRPPRAGGRSAFARSEDDEAPAPPTYDRRARSDPRSLRHATDRGERGPIDLDEHGTADARTNRAAPYSSGSGPYARANGRSRFAQAEEVEAQPAPVRPANSKGARADLRFDEDAGRRMDRYERAGGLDEDDGSEALGEPDVESPERPRNRFRDRPNNRAQDRNSAAPRANGRSRFAEAEEDDVPPTRARPASNRGTGADPRFDESTVRRMDRYERAEDRDEDDGSAPLEPDVAPPRPRNRFGDLPNYRAEDRNSASRELVLVPDRGAYLVRPNDFPPSTDIIYEAPPDPLRGFVPMLWSGARVLFQVAVATLAATAFYLTVWQRNIGQPAQETPATMARDKEVPANANNAAPSSGSGGAGETAPLTTAVGAVSAAATPSPAPGAATFPRPTSYGIYAISNNQLIELEQIATAPVDPRTRSLLQIAKPSRTIIHDARVTFIGFRRDFLSSAPEKVAVRIAARIAHSMIFDASGKPVVTTPETASWLIRDQGYDLRVSPVRDNPEMVALRPDDPDFAFPAGRYELLLGGQHYDFVIAGAVTDPAQCVEGFATVRGPAFNECKPP